MLFDGSLRSQFIVKVLLCIFMTQFREYANVSCACLVNFPLYSLVHASRQG